MTSTTVGEALATCGKPHEDVDPGGSTYVERNRNIALESADAGVNREVVETPHDVQDVGKSAETPTASIEGRE